MSERSLTSADFNTYFQELWCKTPFPWQTALARRLLGEDPSHPEDTWPDAITLPTASGKTACIDIAIFDLAAQARRQERGEALTAPRRIFFVVDRRVIVDEAFERAKYLAKRLKEEPQGILGEVAERLRRLAGGDEPLACFQLRGGIYRDDAWARSPIQPTVVCSTVDQLGSRLLFRAYGRSFKAWPLQAGLAGNDALVLLDEAHCSRPFMDTLRAVAKYREWAEKASPAPFRSVLMTATPPADVSRFPDAQTEQANREHPVLKRRLEAPKRCRLEIAEEATGRDAAKTSRALAEKLVEEAERLVAEYTRSEDETAGLLPAQVLSGAPAVAIFCNRVATARAVYERLSKRHKDETDARTLLLTGRMRPFDRDELLRGPLAGLSARGAEQRSLEAPIFVAATQTLEVGADLDFDLMVTECADLSALRQRFGRLNRMGRPIPARGVIVVRADQTEEQEGGKADPVYGNALPATWRWLGDQCDDQGLVDMGVIALESRLPENLDHLTAEAKYAPVMLPAHVDALAQTAPEPLPSPDVSQFLHGPQAGPADVQVCWRADLVPEQEFDGGDSARAAAWIEAVALCPPASSELMPVPFGAFRRWLLGEETVADTGDVEGIRIKDEISEGREARIVVRWRGREDAEVLTSPAGIRPGDVVVVPASLGGWETLGHKPDRSPADRGEEAHLRARGRAVLRLHPHAFGAWPETATGARAQLAELAQDRERFESEPEALAAEIKDALKDLAAEIEAGRDKHSGSEQGADWLRKIAAHLVKERRLDRCIVSVRRNTSIPPTARSA
ncbi:MAG: type I-U CRISPR-associated helicase/endonuclease Cas3 [Sphingobacteriia bacterium]|nr:type I-U CRISPR-associated helicase/endonuclease Cas3 [Sphingobacteriia bacterium]NCC40613.1 type I-U CRISPR-associated helicase/endonuclease Cas3 [Gammaproteobacteria bacterium]